MSESGYVCAEFIGDPAKRIFVIAHYPEFFSGRCVLVCPPFAEEMNRSRKILTELAKCLLQNDIALVIPDFYGTGDSEGDFADTSVERWLLDLETAERWIEQKGWRVDALLGVRLGCMHAFKYAASRNAPPLKMIFWQPVLDGVRALDQFLRLRVAASLMLDKKETVADLKKEIRSKKSIEVAGYVITVTMMNGLESLKLDEKVGQGISSLFWFEIVRDAALPISLVSKNAIETSMLENKIRLNFQVGEPFWSATEVIVNHELIEKTAQSLIEIPE